MDKLEAMKVFAAVVEEGSFVDASRVLDVSPPAVTRSVARLENVLGIPLFHRSTRHVRLTDSGQHYYSYAKSILESVAEAEAAVTGSYLEPSGQLTVTAPVLFGQKYVMPVISAYLEQHPRVSINAVFLDRVTNLLEDNLDVAIRIGELEDSSLFATRVGSIGKITCASPDYLQAHGTPDSPEQLASHSILHATTVEPLTTWTFGNHRIKVTPRLQGNQNGAIIQAALAGSGLTRLMSYQVADELVAGNLVRVLREFEPPCIPVSVVYLDGRKANAKIRSFVDFAVERLRANELLNPRP